MSSRKNAETVKKIALLELKTGYVFKNKTLAETALTHSSYFNENRRDTQSNERLEFLGDSVLALITSEYLFGHVNRDEGVLTKLKAAIVCENSLYGFAKTLGLGECLLLGKGEKAADIRKSTLADAAEAVLGAIYSDGGMDCAKAFILPHISDMAKKSDIISDYKTMLQEVVQKNKGELLSYEIVSEEGPAHDRRFVCNVKINSNVIAEGCGCSKKDAERAAAKAALELMGIRLLT